MSDRWNPERPVVIAIALLTVVTVACSGGDSIAPDGEVQRPPGVEPGSSVESFDDDIAGDWSWRGARSVAWRLSEGRLAIQTPPTGIFGDDVDDSSLVLRRQQVAAVPLCVEVDLFASPTALYENAGLMLLGDLDNYSVVTLEALPGQHDPPTVLRVFSEVEGEITDDNVVTVEPGVPVRLRMRVDRTKVAGFYRPLDSDEWRAVGSSVRPAGADRIALQTGYGGPGSDRWAEFDNFQIDANCAG